MNSKNKPQKPLSIRKKDAETAIGQAINSVAAENELPFFELEDILFRYYVEVRRGADRERKNDEATYRKKMAEYQQQIADQEKEKEADLNGRDNCASDA